MSSSKRNLMNSTFFVVPGWGNKTPLEGLVDRINIADMGSLDKIINGLFVTQAVDAQPLIEDLIRDYSDVPRVCYVIARLYAGKFVNKVLQPAVSMPNQERSARAIYYAKLAIDFDEARRFLFLSLTEDLDTCITTIQENTRQENLADLYQVIKQKRNFAALFDFARYKLNKTPDENGAFEDFSVILQSSNVEYIGRTIEFLYNYFSSAEKTIAFLNEEFGKHQSGWVGFVLATLLSPVEIYQDKKVRFESLEVLQKTIHPDISIAKKIGRAHV